MKKKNQISPLIFDRENLKRYSQRSETLNAKRDLIAYIEKINLKSSKNN